LPWFGAGYKKKSSSRRIQTKHYPTSYRFLNPLKTWLLSNMRNTNADPTDILIEAFRSHERAVNEYGGFLCLSRKA
jgi:hypothetical protein